MDATIIIELANELGYMLAIDPNAKLYYSPEVVEYYEANIEYSNVDYDTDLPF